MTLKCVTRPGGDNQLTVIDDVSTEVTDRADTGLGTGTQTHRHTHTCNMENGKSKGRNLAT